MPASASAPPDGISTVVSARRARIEGTVSVWLVPGYVDVIAFSVERSDTSVTTFMLMRPSPSTTGVKDRLTPNFLKSICCWQIGGIAWSCRRTAVRDREFAAGEEGRGLAGNRGEVRLRERPDDAGAFHRVAGSR